MTNKVAQEKAYMLAVEFIDAINTNDKEKLKEKFSVSQAVLDEIYEEIEYFFDGIPPISLPSIETAFLSRNPKTFFDFYKMDDDIFWGAECTLFVDGKIAEPILHLEFIERDDELFLTYKYLGS
ncbi:hypothetical protein [Iodobacter ciconiae]|uniref:Uncharacterized protein n=1 Tax=Iodobacter ciconiae TaxID=2496266 RepID=A0A3S8ZPU7_9NEIS|nr:hypothetical protein [Iodobacter ciconiae]AZN35503.1 hypothetical protein EJO50_02770 [Iodobacter ciconiae]